MSHTLPWVKLGRPVLALAPMQDVTDLAFWRLIARYGGADVYFTEYFRVQAHSKLEKYILDSITSNPTGKPAVAQMIGNHIPGLVRSAKELLEHPVAGIDLNLGCPAPIVYKKCAGGGLLRDLPLVDRILGELRNAIPGVFSVKTRIGFDSAVLFDELLALFQKHQVDAVTVHGRTVLQMYRPGVRYDLIAHAASSLTCPVIANGDITSANQALDVVRTTSASGIMLGRGAIRNPWLFDQIRARCQGLAPALPTGRQVLAYIEDLFQSVTEEGTCDRARVNKLKKYMNFLGQGLPRSTDFLHSMRRAEDVQTFFALCRDHLEHDEALLLTPEIREQMS